MFKAKGYAAMKEKGPLEPFSFERRQLLPNDVQIEILYCGICHSDLHLVRNDWRISTYPMVPGHEIVGRITKIGSNVGNFKVGDLAGVGCFVDSCRNCPSCKEHLEHYCEVGITLTYNSVDKNTRQVTYGGYSDCIVVDKDYLLHIPEKFNDMNLAGVAPLLCAGITTYSPLRHWKVSKGQKVGVVGLGGLGHMALKIAKALGAHVVLFTTSPNKVDDAKRLGADEVVMSKNLQEIKKHTNSFDFIINTVAASHNLNMYIDLLKRDCTMCLVGLPDKPHDVLASNVLIQKRRSIAGSFIGGIRETQEMLDFCAEHNITADVEIISMQDINFAYERLQNNDVKYRFVIDMSYFV